MSRVGTFHQLKGGNIPVNSMSGSSDPRIPMRTEASCVFQIQERQNLQHSRSDHILRADKRRVAERGRYTGQTERKRVNPFPILFPPVSKDGRWKMKESGTLTIMLIKNSLIICSKKRESTRGEYCFGGIIKKEEDKKKGKQYDRRVENKNIKYDRS